MKLIIYKIPSDIFPVADAVGSVVFYLLAVHDGEWWVQWVMLTLPIEILGFKSLLAMAAQGFLVSWKLFRSLGVRCNWWGIWSTSLRPDHCLRITQLPAHLAVGQIVLQDGIDKGEDGTNRILHSFLALPQLKYPDMLHLLAFIHFSSLHRHSPFRQHKTKDKHEIDRMTLTVVRPGLGTFPELPFPLKLELHTLLSQRKHGRAVPKHHQREGSRAQHFHHGISLCISFLCRTWSSRIPFLPSSSPFWKGSCSGMWARGLDAKEEGRCCLLLGPLPWKISTSLSMSEFISSEKSVSCCEDFNFGKRTLRSAAAWNYISASIGLDMFFWTISVLKAFPWVPCNHACIGWCSWFSSLGCFSGFAWSVLAWNHMTWLRHTDRENILFILYL